MPQNRLNLTHLDIMQPVAKGGREGKFLGLFSAKKVK